MFQAAFLDREAQPFVGANSDGLARSQVPHVHDAQIGRRTGEERFRIPQQERD